jgi:hypothetical protein
MGAPELVVEISGSTVSYDLHAKLNIYRRAGVREYVVWRVYDGAVDWFLLEDGRYVAQTPDAQGCYHSQIFPGLILPVPALLAGELAQVLGAVQQGVQTPEHGAFVQRLLDLGVAKTAPTWPGSVSRFAPPTAVAPRGCSTPLPAAAPSRWKPCAWAAQ